MNFFKEVWLAYRPYLVKLTVDFLVPVTMWVGLFIFTSLTNLLPIPGWAGEFVIHLHSAGTVAAIGIFGWLSINDIIQIHGRGLVCFA